MQRNISWDEADLSLDADFECGVASADEDGNYQHPEAIEEADEKPRCRTILSQHAIAAEESIPHEYCHKRESIRKV